MERIGEITAVRGDELEVTFCRPADCEKCHACLGGEKQHVLTVRGSGRVGDRAVISVPSQTIVRASMIAYLIPVLAMFACMLLGTLLLPEQDTLGAALGGVIGLGGALLCIRLTEKRRSQKGRYEPTLVRVIPAGEAQ